MKPRLSDLWRWRGTIDRGEYAFWGLLLFAVKYNLDRIISAVVFHRPWFLTNYFVPSPRETLLSLKWTDALFFQNMLILALPFIWVGIVLTLRRLRSLRWPLWFVFLFFIPVVNLFFFLLLCVLPSVSMVTPARSRARGFLDQFIPSGPWGSAALGLVINAISGLVFTALSVNALQNYGWGLFVGLPFCLGFTSVLIYTYHGYRKLGSCLAVACCSVILLSGLLFMFAFEGMICLMMAAPLALILAMFGAAIAYAIQFHPRKQEETPKMFSMLLVLPLLITGESARPSEAPVFAVTTSVEIDAPPEMVWPHVIHFPELTPPEEWVFRAGIAYPVRAQIFGQGVGAVRHCVFSTGEFTEPITVWQEPELLQFSVTANPDPMREWSFRSGIRPAHLQYFFVSRQGQFFLVRLPGNRTRLEGTTWYQHHMWPARYWKMWSDLLIHQIHFRVLRHVKEISETVPSSA